MEMFTFRCLKLCDIYLVAGFLPFSEAGCANYEKVTFILNTLNSHLIFRGSAFLFNVRTA